MTLKLSKSRLCKGALFLLFGTLFIRLLTDNFGLSYIVMPLFDIILLGLLALALFFKSTKNSKKLWVLLMVYCVVAIISIIVNGGTTISDFFYEIRPYLRYVSFIVFAFCALEINHLKQVYKITKWLLYINFVIMVFQFAFWGLRQDVIGGTFGNTQGVNSIQNVLCIFVFSVSLVKYLYHKINQCEMIINTLVVLGIAILAEINLLLFEMAIIAIGAFVLCRKKKKFSWRYVLLIVAGSVTAVVGVIVFIRMNPDRLFLFSLDNILEYIGAKGGTGVYRISRVRVFSDLGNRFFGNNLSEWLFGYGLGNCSTHTSFYNMYGNLQYTYFSSSFVFLETGLVGVSVCLFTILFPLIHGLKNRSKIVDTDKMVWINSSTILSLILFILFFYNSTMRDTYTAFWAGLFSATPFIATLKNYKTNKKAFISGLMINGR